MKIFNKFLILLLILTLCNLKSQHADQYTYARLTDLFDAYPENDERAMVFVNFYISKAKNHKHFPKLIEGYEEAVYYCHSVEKKIKYADSAVAVALMLKNRDLISTSHLKRGIIFYYNKRDYQKALREYLIAFNNAKNTKDLYLLNKILYHLGMVKCYLGYYQEAAIHFNETARYYEKYMFEREHPNIRSNNEHGYLNSIYRLSTCYRNLRFYQKEDSLIDIGVNAVKSSREFAQEFAYFQKAKGIQSLRNGQINAAEKYLKRAGHILQNKEDFAALATVYFYLGRLHFTTGRREESLIYLNRVDSILNKFNLITPEVVNAYKYLIQDAKEKGDDRLQLYYSTKLIKAESLITSDFAVMSTKIYRDFQVGIITDSQDKLISKYKYGSTILVLIVVLGFLAFYFFVIRSRQKEKLLTARYNELLEKLNKEKNDQTAKKSIEVNSNIIKSIHSDELIKEIIKNLRIFEDKKQFLKKDIKLPDVAKLVKSNRSTLSFVLNEYMQTSFTQYIKVLRIQYITNQLADNKVYLKYSMDTLAAECGMKNRTIFSNHFLEINGIRPMDFVRKRLEELEET